MGVPVPRPDFEDEESTASNSTKNDEDEEPETIRSCMNKIAMNLFLVSMFLWFPTLVVWYSIPMQGALDYRADRDFRQVEGGCYLENITFWKIKYCSDSCTNYDVEHGHSKYQCNYYVKYNGTYLSDENLLTAEEDKVEAQSSNTDASKKYYYFQDFLLLKKYFKSDDCTVSDEELLKSIPRTTYMASPNRSSIYVPCWEGIKPKTSKFYKCDCMDEVQNCETMKGRCLKITNPIGILNISQSQVHESYRMFFGLLYVTGGLLVFPLIVWTLIAIVDWLEKQWFACFPPSSEIDPHEDDEEEDLC
eukprot:g2340.t1